MKIRKPLEKHSDAWLKKELKENYLVLDSYNSTSLSYEIASDLIRKIEKILQDRGR